VKQGFLKPSLQWSNPRPAAERLKGFQHLCNSNGWKCILSGACGASSNEVDEGDEWTPKRDFHTAFTELGIPHGTRVLGEQQMERGWCLIPSERISNGQHMIQYLASCLLNFKNRPLRSD
jgi:hypothetical protein